ncbi:uncharacterized protein LOC118467645 [Anopheles albimanus]|uniref:uncharacterized protein LOC118467645 n=1 Tax=Anopheles albimanus TaxID=7167 RepID=UPI00163E446F|nr:uncharacterized protein LOC118467645 [Anopheles albimanus]XP_035794273.1 uncharacterized protein LOC118467645 [Anopheles albimanus]
MQSDHSWGDQFAEHGKNQREKLGDDHENRPLIATNWKTCPTADTTQTALGMPTVKSWQPGLMLPIISSTTTEPSYDRPQASGSFQDTHPVVKPAKGPRDSTPADEIVVSNGDVFHIRFIDEPPIDDDLPSSTYPIVQPDDQLFDGTDGSYTYTDEPSGDRDWINYDELPMLSKHNSVAQASHSGSAHATVETYGSGALCHPSLLISAESSERPDTEATLTHNPLALSVEGAARREKRAEVSSQRKRRNRRRKIKPTTTGTDSNDGWHGFRNYCVECTKFFPTAEDLELHMESCHRLVDDLPPAASMLLVDDLALCGNTSDLHLESMRGSWPQTQLNHVPNAREMELFYSDLFHRSANEFR